MEIIKKKNKQLTDLDALSRAPSNAYKGFSKKKTKKPIAKKDTSSLPSFIQENLYDV